VPDLLKEALTCLDRVTDTDGTIRNIKTKVIVNLPFHGFTYCCT
jgi:hypothetical protein